MDRRVRKTKEILKTSLISLMKDKDYRSITVTDLTEKADINRGTFYLHYMDIYELLAEIEASIVNELLNISLKYDCSKVGYVNTLYEVIDYVEKEKEFFKVIFSPNGDISFIERIKPRLLDVFISASFPKSIIGYDKQFIHHFAIFIVSGGIGIFQEWIKNDCKTPLKPLVAKFEEVFLKIKFQ